jgi:molecular chaperone GrpE
MRNDMLRAQAELVNFRNRVERDRAANREAVVAEVLRAFLPALDDLARAEAHGDVPEGSGIAIVAQRIRASFEKYGVRPVGAKGDPFDPNFHEALVQLPSADVQGPTVADVIEIGYAINDRLLRPAKVAVSVPE